MLNYIQHIAYYDDFGFCKTQKIDDTWRLIPMTYIVAEPCVNCRYTDCALVCPVEAFHLDDDMLVIHPETCIDCDACVPECPVEAVFAEDKLPAEWASFTKINADRALSGLPTINVRLDPLCQ